MNGFALYSLLFFLLAGSEGLAMYIAPSYWLTQRFHMFGDDAMSPVEKLLARSYGALLLSVCFSMTFVAPYNFCRLTLAVEILLFLLYGEAATSGLDGGSGSGLMLQAGGLIAMVILNISVLCCSTKEEDKLKTHSAHEYYPEHTGNRIRCSLM
jgi:hypothetical protein